MLKAGVRAGRMVTERMYSDLFSRVYDAFGWNYYPEAFAELLLGWIRKNDMDVQSMLDIGCGTGVLCSILYEHGIRAQGMDLSSGMIAMAREKYPELVFEQGNMITYESDRRFDLVTSTCDAMNHILDPGDFAQVLRHVHGYLAPGGHFLFDLLKREETEECEPVDLGELNGKRLQFQIHRTEDGFVTLQIEVFEAETLVHTEVIRERMYDPEEVVRMLRDAGFAKAWYTDRLLEEESERASTWFVIAEK